MWGLCGVCRSDGRVVVIVAAAVVLVCIFEGRGQEAGSDEARLALNSLCCC